MLNVALTAQGHRPLSAQTLHALMEATGGHLTETPGAAREGLERLADVVASHRCRLRRKEALVGDDDDDRDDAKEEEAAAAILRAFAAAGLASASHARRLACFDKLAPLTGLTAEECQLCREVAAVEVIDHAWRNGRGTSRRRRCAGGVPALFTAPHGIFLRREGEGVHKPEEWTTLIATQMAKVVGGISMTWCDAERTQSRLTRRPNGTNRDPNCVEPSEVLEYNWGRLLARHASRTAAGDDSGESHEEGGGNARDDDPESSLETREDREQRVTGRRAEEEGEEDGDRRRRRRWMECLHVDIHGRRDPAVGAHEIGFSDCDLGVVGRWKALDIP